LEPRPTTDANQSNTSTNLLGCKATQKTSQTPNNKQRLQTVTATLENEHNTKYHSMEYDESDRHIEPKVVVLGQTGVGKTSMIHRYTKGNFNDNTQTTIGGAYCKKDVQVNGWNVSLQIWDTAGQERFRSMAPMYYRNAKAAVLVYDCTDEKTLEKVQGWADELIKYACKDVVFVLAGNKYDMAQLSSTEIAKAQGKAKELGATFFQTSAKTGKGIRELFDFIAGNVLESALKSNDGINRSSGVLMSHEPHKATCCS